MVSSSLLAALCKRVLCFKVTARYLGSGCGLKLGRQAAWRPGTIGMVSSSLLAAPCKQLLCLKVTARYLGSGCRLKLGRQAAWRPGTIRMVLSSWLAAPCKQLLCLQVIAETWALATGSNSVVKLLGGRGVRSEWRCQSGTSNRPVDVGDAYPCDRSPLEAWCETSLHVKVERMDTFFFCSGRGELEGKN